MVTGFYSWLPRGYARLHRAHTHIYTHVLYGHPFIWLVWFVYVYGLFYARTVTRRLPGHACSYRTHTRLRFGYARILRFASIAGYMPSCVTRLRYILLHAVAVWFLTRLFTGLRLRFAPLRLRFAYTRVYRTFGWLVSLLRFGWVVPGLQLVYRVILVVCCWILPRSCRTRGFVYTRFCCWLPTRTFTAPRCGCTRCRPHMHSSTQFTGSIAFTVYRAALPVYAFTFARTVTRLVWLVRLVTVYADYFGLPTRLRSGWFAFTHVCHTLRYVCIPHTHFGLPHTQLPFAGLRFVGCRTRFGCCSLPRSLRGWLRAFGFPHSCRLPHVALRWILRYPRLPCLRWFTHLHTHTPPFGWFGWVTVQLLRAAHGSAHIAVLGLLRLPLPRSRLPYLLPCLYYGLHTWFPWFGWFTFGCRYTHRTTVAVPLYTDYHPICTVVPPVTFTVTHAVTTPDSRYHRFAQFPVTPYPTHSCRFVALATRFTHFAFVRGCALRFTWFVYAHGFYPPPTRTRLRAYIYVTVTVYPVLRTHGLFGTPLVYTLIPGCYVYLYQFTLPAV